MGRSSFRDDCTALTAVAAGGTGCAAIGDHGPCRRPAVLLYTRLHTIAGPRSCGLAPGWNPAVERTLSARWTCCEGEAFLRTE